MATPKLGYGTVQEHGKKVNYQDKNAEIARTQQVIANRQKEGLDLTSQLSHYKNLTGQEYKAPEPSYLDKFQQQINTMFDQQKQAQLAQLQAQRDRAVGQLNQQKAEVKPAYRGLKNQTDAVNLQGVQKLREAMASAGLTSSGENVTAQVGLVNQRQNSLNSLNLQEQQQLNDLDRRIADVNNPAEAQAIINQIEAQRAQARLNFGMQAEQMDYTRGRDSVMDNRWQTQFDYGVGRDRVGDNQWQQQFAYQQERDKIGDEWTKRQFDEQVRQFGIQNAIAWARENRISSGGGGSGGGNTNQVEDVSFGPITSQLNRNYYAKNPETGLNQITDPEALYDAILGLNLNGNQTRQLVNMYGLQGIEERKRRADEVNWWSNVTR